MLSRRPPDRPAATTTSSREKKPSEPRPSAIALPAETVEKEAQ